MTQSSIYHQFRISDIDWSVTELDLEDAKIVPSVINGEAGFSELVWAQRFRDGSWDLLIIKQNKVLTLTYSEPQKWVDLLGKHGPQNGETFQVSDLSLKKIYFLHGKSISGLEQLLRKYQNYLPEELLSAMWKTLR